MHTVIIGNGAATSAAISAFRRHNTYDPLTIIATEGKEAYSRVLLPYVLRERVPYQNIFLPRDYQKWAATVKEDTVLNIIADERKLMLKKGGMLEYDQLLIASGAHAIKPPLPGLDLPGVHHLWTKEDLDALLPLFASKKSVLVIGSGFVALQAAWAACCRGLKTRVVELEQRIMPRVLDQGGSAYMQERLQDHGVEVHTQTRVTGLKQDQGQLRVYHGEDKYFGADIVIVGAGIAANSSMIPQEALLENGFIPVSNKMESSLPHVYAAGDVAAGPSAFDEPHVNHGLWPTAIEMGTIAGANMAGEKQQYPGSVNMNVTQMFGVTVASMGKFQDEEIDYGEIVGAKDDYFKLGYRDGKIVGICLLGGPQSLSLLGRMRPLLREHISPLCPPQKLDAFLNIRLFAKGREVR